MFYKKGDRVWYIVNWNQKGAIRIYDATVYAAGKKRMILTDNATGKELGRNFVPTDVEHNHGHFNVVIAGTRQDAEARALKQAEAVLAYERAHFARCLAGNHGAGYDAVVRKDIAALHEPVILWEDPFK